MRLHSLLDGFGAMTRPLRLVRALRGTVGTIGLAMALVAGQGGAFLHELSHYASALPPTSTSPTSDSTTPVGDSQRQQPQSPDHGSKVCDLCLAFAQLAGVLHSDTFVSPMVADLRDTATAFDAPVVVAAETPAPRSRGPPAFL